MKRLVFSCLFFCCFFTAMSQKEAAIWYFGEHAGLDFRSGAPVALLDGKLTTTEGCSTISNSNGDLLFYSDGITVWNKDHAVMENGEGLLGDPSSSQSAIIVPNPSSPNLYYIFTVSYSLNYSVVDMSRENGLGAITNVKNEMLATPTTEKVTAVQHANGNDIWVITHENSNDVFQAFLVTSGGVNPTPVTSAVGLDLTNGKGHQVIGYLKASPNGKKLAIAHRNNAVELLDFDSRTGKITNPLRLLENEDAHYGVEFSPSNKILYTTTEEGNIYQFDLLAADIPGSRLLIHKSEAIYSGALQLALDGKIYLSNYLRQELDVINDPDVLGTGCNFQEMAVDLGGRISTFGLPPFIQSYFNIGGITAENLCLGDTTSFSLDIEDPIEAIQWEFGDGHTSTEKSPTHKYAAAGVYEVKVTVTKDGKTDVETLEIIISEIPKAYPIKDVEVCSTNNRFEFDLSVLKPEVLGPQSEEDHAVTFFSTRANAEANTAALPVFLKSTNTEEIIYARLSKINNSTCFDIAEFKIYAKPTPVLADVSDWMVCSTSGNFAFDLSQKDAEVLGSQNPQDFTVLYFLSHEDADENKLSVTSVTGSANSNPSIEIFYRLHNSQYPMCYQTGSFNLRVGMGGIDVSPKDLASCDEGAGFGSFDTSLWEQNILNGRSGFKLTYYNSAGQALSTPLPARYRNKTAFTEKIIVKIQDDFSPDCITETSFNLQAISLEEVPIMSTYYLCPVTPFTTLDFKNMDYETWDWKFEGTSISSTGSAFLDKSGNYSLTVSTSQMGVRCEKTYKFTVEELANPVITAVNYRDFSESNYIEIIATTENGNLVYSIDGINFQDSNYFGNVSGGLYTVYAYDDPACGTATSEILIMDYPKFFTPNGDGHNDRWQLEGTNTLPEVPIQIFDRYGKLIKRLSSREPGWDGTYNGREMPTDDYWFSTMLDGRTFKAHFTLRRE